MFCLNPIKKFAVVLSLIPYLCACFSAELLKIWNDRESTLVSEEGTENEKTLCGCLATRPLACLPEAKGAMLGKLGHFLEKSGADDVWDRVAGEAARTVPGRENGVSNASEDTVALMRRSTVS